MSHAPAAVPKRRRLVRIASWIGAALGLAVIALWLAASAYFSTLIAQPPWRRPDPAAHAAAVEALRVSAGGTAFAVTTTEGLVLRGLRLPARPDNDQLVVMLHGYGGNLLEYREQFTFWRDLGFDVVLYDQRASGASDGEVLSAGLLESRDVDAVMAWARSTMPAGARVGLYGRSGGGATAVMYTGAGGRPDFVVVDCAYSDFPRQLLDRLAADYGVVPAPLHRPMLATTLAWVRLRFGIDLSQAVPLGVAPGIAVPALFVTTEGDTYIDPRMTRELYDAVQAPKRLHLFDGGGHGTAMHDHPEAYAQAVTRFLHDLVDHGTP